MDQYQDYDMAYIQDVAFDVVASYAKQFLIDLFEHHAKSKGLAIDLGCGTGKTLLALVKKGYHALGIDTSQAAINLAKKNVANADFICASIYDVDLKPCHYVIATDIVLNYLPLSEDPYELLDKLFRKIYRLLKKNGLFVFDILLENINGIPRNKQRFIDTADWTVYIERQEDILAKTIRREITLFRKVGKTYRKSQRVDVTVSLDSTKIIALLQQAGFTVKKFHQYGAFKFTEDHLGLIAERPA